jgi:hypothetical protein
VAPDTGDYFGEDAITITGTDFTEVHGVTFGNNFVNAINPVVVNDTTITCTTPPVNRPGNGSPDTIGVHNQHGTGYSTTTQWAYTGPYEPSPSTGPQAGGTSVSILGTQLSLVTGVNFGGTPATGFVAVSDTEVTCVTPPGTGTAVVTLDHPSGPMTVQWPFTYT